MKFAILNLGLVFYCSAYAVEFACETVSKYSPLGEVRKDTLAKYKFLTKIKEEGGTAIFSRCGHESAAGKVTCDDYKIEKIVKDENVGIKKYYYFRGQADIQIFKDLTAIENNGRGSISFQKCKITAP